MKIISFATLKGGAGKTANCFNMAGVLAENFRVLLVDVDPQGNLSANMGIDTADADLLTINDIFSNFTDSQPKPEEVIIKGPVKELPNLDILPSSIMLFDTEMNMVSVSARESFLTYYFLDNKEYFESNYDYVFIDTNPSMSIMNINAFFVSDSIVLTSDVSRNSIKGAELFCSLWDNKRKALRKKPNVAALFMGNVDRRSKKEYRDILGFYDNVSESSKGLMTQNYIPQSKIIKTSEAECKPVNVLAATHSVKKFREQAKEITESYVTIIEELLEKGVF